MTREQMIDEAVRCSTTPTTRLQIAAYIRMWGNDDAFLDVKHYGPEFTAIVDEFRRQALFRA